MEATGRPSWRPAIQAAAIAAAAGFAYAPALQGSWLWDDPTEVSQNPILRARDGLARIWRGEGSLDYFPLKTSLQWMEWHLWGDRVLGYHLASLALHIVAAILLWRLLARLGVRAAFFGGLIFALHPLCVESVAWISEFKNVLSLALLLGAMIAYAVWDGEGPPDGSWKNPAKPSSRRAAYLASLLLFLAALLSKISVIAFPSVLLLYAFWRRGRLRGRDFRAVSPFLAASLALGSVAVHFQHSRVMAHLQMPAEGLATRVAAAGCAVWFYLGKCVLPVGFLPIYPRWSLQPTFLWLVLPWAGIAAAFVWFWRRRAGWGRHALFGFGSFVLNLAPALGLVPIAYLRISRVSDHLAYLAFASIAALAAAAVSSLLTAESRGRFGKGWVYGACGLTAAAAALASRGYARVFSSEEALWTYTVDRNPDAWLAHNNLGILFGESGRLAAAIREGEEAVRLKPDFAEARANLGRTLAQAGRNTEALEQLDAAIRLDPNLAGAHLDLGEALLAAGRPGEALPEFAAALRLKAGYPDAIAGLGAAHNNMGNALARSGRLEQAVAEFREALKWEPTNAGVHRNLGFALRSLGREAEAEDEFRQAGR